MKGPKHILLLGLLTTFLIAQPQSSRAEDLTPLVQSARQLTQQFFSKLKSELIKAMQDGGPVNAIDVCHKKALQIAKSVSEDSGWDVKRVSLRPRNPYAEPDDFEKQILVKFDREKRSGKDPKDLEYATKVVEDGQPVFRYMKAIPTSGICLTCHGKRLNPLIAEKIHEYYPNDKATGYKVGDIRGAFSLKKVLRN